MAWRESRDGLGALLAVQEEEDDGGGLCRAGRSSRRLGRNGWLCKLLRTEINRACVERWRGEAVAVPSHAPFVPQPLTPAISRLGKGAEAEAPR